MTRKTRTVRGAAALLVAGMIAGLAAGCGEEKFKNEPREAVPIELTGVIQENKVTVSPNRVGAGPIVITISNQTNEAHTVTLEGESIRERVGPINPLDTATITKSVAPGVYEVRAGSEAASTREIEPARLKVGRKRPDSNERLLLP